MMTAIWIMIPFAIVKNTVANMMTAIPHMMIGRDISLCIHYQCDDNRCNCGQSFTSMMSPISIVMEDHFKPFDKPLYVSW